MRDFLKKWVREHPSASAFFVVTATFNLLSAGYIAYAYITYPDTIPTSCINKPELVAQYWRNFKKQLVVYGNMDRPSVNTICFYEDPETYFSLTHNKDWGKDHLISEMVEYLHHHPEMIDSPFITVPAREAFRRQEGMKPQ